MVRTVAGDLPEQVKNNQYVNQAAGNGGQKMSQYSWFTVYSLCDIIQRYFALTFAKLNFFVDMSIRFFVGKQYNRLNIAREDKKYVKYPFRMKKHINMFFAFSVVYGKISINNISLSVYYKSKIQKVTDSFCR